jgi:hypothetical protein
MLKRWQTDARKADISLVRWGCKSALRALTVIDHRYMPQADRRRVNGRAGVIGSRWSNRRTTGRSHKSFETRHGLQCSTRPQAVSELCTGTFYSFQKWWWHPKWTPAENPFCRLWPDSLHFTPFRCRKSSPANGESEHGGQTHKM